MNLRLLRSCLALLTVVAGLQMASTAGAAELYLYEGTMIADKGEAEVTTKKIKLAVLQTSADGQSGRSYWVVSENGRGELSWPMRFGAADWSSTDSRGLFVGVDAIRGPAVLYQFEEERTGFVPIAMPRLNGTEIKADESWKQGAVTYRVIEEEAVGGIPAWRIVGFTNIGVKRTIWVSKSGTQVLSLNERVVLGRGLMHDLDLKLVQQIDLDDNLERKMATAFDVFLKFRGRLGVEKQAREINWSDEQLALLRENVERLVKVSVETPLESIGQTLADDIKNQKGRNNSVAVLAERAMNKSLGDFGDLEFDTYRGAELNADTLKGKVTILHFWEYKDSPLAEPYGQVGYLDFLLRRYKDKDVQVVGVVCNPLLEDPTQRSKVRVGARKFASFMNLTYSIVGDSKGFIGRIGDPRKAGAKLPLFVVIDADGKVVHYHAGYYEVDRVIGLKALDDIIAKTVAGE